jgi:TP901 family phage tail tape measure protein
MANIEKTVKIIFGGEDTGLRLTTSSVAKNLNDLDGQIGKMAQPLANFSDNILKIDAVLAALAVGAIALAINKAGEFGGSFKEISTLIDASSTDIANFRTEVLAYAQSSGKSIADINQAIYKAVSAGIDYKVVLAELSTAEKLSIAGRNDLASTTVLLAGTMNAYGAKASEAGHYSDVFMETVRKGLTTLPELAGSLANVTGIASMGKVPIETLSAAIAALTATGIPTEQAITGMKNVIANIIKPTAEAKAEAEKLGIQFNATALQTKGLETVLWDAWRATGGNAEAMNTLFGSIRGLNAATVLASDSSGRFKDILQDMSTVAGTTETAYAKMAGGFSEVNQNIKNNIDVLLIDVGQRLMPEYGKIAGSLSDVMKGVKIGLDAGAFDPLFAELDKYGSQIAETLKTIAKNLPEAMKGLDFSGLISSLQGLGGSLGEAFKSIFGEVDLTTVEGLHAVIQRIINALGKLIDVTKGIIDGMEPLFKAMGMAIEGFEGMDKSSASMVGTILGAAKSVSVLAEYAGVLTGALAVLGGKAMLDATVGLVKFGASAVEAIPGIIGFVGSLGMLGSLGALGAAAAVGGLTGSLLNQIPAVTSGSQALLGLLDVNKDFFGAQTLTKEQMDKVNLAYDQSVKKVNSLGQELKNVPAKTTAQVTMDTMEFDDWKVRFKAGEDKFNLSLKTTIDQPSFKDTADIIQSKFGGGTMIKITTELDGTSTLESVSKFNAAFPKEMKVDVKPDITQVTIADMKAKSDIIQKSVEWKGKIDIAQIEAGTKTIEAAFKSVNVTIESTGKTLTDLTGTYATLVTAGAYEAYFVEREVQAESRRRDEAMQMQKTLVDAQVNNMNARTDALKKGQAMITIDGKGLQPQLEAFLFEILKAIQVKANSEGAQYLVGI